MGTSRTKNSIINMIASIGYQALILLLSFLSRTIFIKVLGEGYLGINGLFTNILSVLSLAELGIGTAIIYNMYKPVTENDTDKICRLVNYYKKLYNTIALLVTILGLLVLPFFKYLIKLDEPIDNIKLYYILFLINTVSSYLFVYKTSVIIVHQKEYITKIFSSIINVISFFVQIIVLVLFKNYAIYILVGIICSVINNAFCAYKAQKMYPYISEKKELEKKEKETIWKNIKSMFCYKVGGVILNNTDNILISSMISTTMIGFCSNYILIVEAVKKITSLFFTSIQASIGNLNAEANAEKQYEVFRMLNLGSFAIYGFCSICLAILLQDFIFLWLGEKFILNINIAYITVFNFYITGMLYPIWNYRETIGLFNDTKYIMFFASGVNLILSILGGLYFGVAGILLATAIARITTNMWYEPYKLFKIYFKKNVLKYYFTQIEQCIELIIIIAIIKCILDRVIIENMYFRFILKMVLCVIIAAVFLFLRIVKTKEFKSIKVRINEQIINKK